MTVAAAQSIGDKSTGAHPTAIGIATSIGIVLLLIGDIPNISYGVWAPKSAVLLVLGAIGLPTLVYRAFGTPGNRAPSVRWSSRMALTFLLVAVIAASLSTSPALSWVGNYNQGTGVLFWAAAAGCYALGSTANGGDRKWIEGGFITGALINACVAVLQAIHDLSSAGIPSYENLPTGLMGNPVFLGPVLAGSLALVAHRFRRAFLPWSMAAGLIGLALGVSGERLPALLSLMVLTWVVWNAWKANDGTRTPVRGAIVSSVITVLSIAAGSIWEQLRSGTGSGVISHVATATASETFGQRLSEWNTALHVIAIRPFLGFGPGLFEQATLPHTSASASRLIGNLVFTDSHNFLLEVGVTTGLAGLAVMVAWLTLATVGRSGAFLILALVLLASELAEPLNVAVTPLAFLALGASQCRQRKRVADWDRPPIVNRAAILLAVVTAIPAVALIVGDAAYVRSSNEYNVGRNNASLASATTANTLLRPWPEAASLLANIWYFDDLNRRPGAEGESLFWAATAARRDPGDPTLWTALAQDQLHYRHLRDARVSTLRAVADDPYWSAADYLLGLIDYLSHDSRDADYWWRRSLIGDPSQPLVRAELRGQCLPSLQSAKSEKSSCRLLGFSDS